MSAWIPGLCWLASIGIVASVAVWVEHRRNRKAKPHPLAPVIPLRTHYVVIVPPRKGSGGAA